MIPLMEPSGSSDYIDSRTGRGLFCRDSQNGKKPSLLAALAAARSRADSGGRGNHLGQEAPARRSAELRSGLLVHAGQRRSQARRLAGRQEPVADRFQIHARARQGPAVAGPGRGSRPRDDSGAGCGCGCASTTAVSALAPSGYNLGVAVGWRRFAVSGDVAKVKDADPALGGRETAVVGVSLFAQQSPDHAPGAGRRALDRQAASGAAQGRQYVARRRRRLTRSRGASR